MVYVPSSPSPSAPPPPPVELKFNCGDFSKDDLTESGAIAGFSIGIATCLICLFIAYKLYKKYLRDVAEEMRSYDTYTRKLVFFLFILLGGIAGFSYGIYDTVTSRHKIRANNWPTTTEQVSLCKDFINLKHINGESVQVTNVLSFTLPKNKAINRLKFLNLVDKTFKLTVRKTISDTEFKEVSIDLQTKQLKDPYTTQTEYDVFYSSDYELIVSSNNSFSLTFESHEIPSEYVQYINSRGIIGKICPQSLLFVNADHSIIKTNKVYCEVL